MEEAHQTLGGLAAGTIAINDSRPTAPFGFESDVILQRTIRLGTTVEELASAIHPHPTLTEAFGLAALAAHG